MDPRARPSRQQQQSPNSIVYHPPPSGAGSGLPRGGPGGPGGAGGGGGAGRSSASNAPPTTVDATLPDQWDTLLRQSDTTSASNNNGGGGARGGPLRPSVGGASVIHGSGSIIGVLPPVAGRPSSRQGHGGGSPHPIYGEPPVGGSHESLPPSLAASSNRPRPTRTPESSHPHGRATPAAYGPAAAAAAAAHGGTPPPALPPVPQPPAPAAQQPPPPPPAPTAVGPTLQRALKERMVITACATLIEYSAQVHASMLDVRNKTDEELDEILAGFMSGNTPAGVVAAPSVVGGPGSHYHAVGHHSAGTTAHNTVAGGGGHNGVRGSEPATPSAPQPRSASTAPITVFSHHPGGAAPTTGAVGGPSTAASGRMTIERELYWIAERGGGDPAALLAAVASGVAAGAGGVSATQGGAAGSGQGGVLLQPQPQRPGAPHKEVALLSAAAISAPGGPGGATGVLGRESGLGQPLTPARGSGAPTPIYPPSSSSALHGLSGSIDGGLMVSLAPRNGGGAAYTSQMTQLSPIAAGAQRNAALNAASVPSTTATSSSKRSSSAAVTVTVKPKPLRPADAHPSSSSALPPYNAGAFPQDLSQQLNPPARPSGGITRSESSAFTSYSGNSKAQVASTAARSVV